MSQLEEEPIPAPEPEPPLPYSRQSLTEVDIEAVAAVMRSDRVTQGPSGPLFEAALAKACGANHAIAVSHGTAALQLACLALGAKSGAVGIVPAVTFVGTANAVIHCGAEVVFADVDPETGLMTPETANAAMASTPAETGLLLPVSLNGRTPDLPGLQREARTRQWPMLEDAAHSLGGTYSDTEGMTFRSGSCTHTEAAILSFHPVKHICTGEGGAVLTRFERIADQISLRRTGGVIRPVEDASEDRPGWFYDQQILGFNFRLTDMQAALGISQLQRLNAFVEARRRIADRYLQILDEAPFTDCFTLPPNDAGHAWHLFPIRFRKEAWRDAAHRFLQARNIITQVHYRPVYQHSWYKVRFPGLSLPGAEAYSRSCLSIPCFPGLREAEMERVVHALRDFCRDPDRVTYFRHQ